MALDPHASKGVPHVRELRKRRLLAFAALVPLALVLAAIVVTLLRPPPDTGGRPVKEADRARLREAIQAARRRLDSAEAAQAQLLMETALQDFPLDQDVRILYAESLLQQGLLPEAFEQYQQALVVGSGFPELHFSFGTVADELRQVEIAEQQYLLAQAGEPTNPQYPLYLGVVQRKLGKLTEAKAAFLRAARLDPTLAIAWGELADISLGENNLSVAMTHVRRAREAAPESDHWRLVEARILRRDNRPDEAARLLMAIPEGRRLADRFILEELGRCYGMLRRPEFAAEVYAQAVERAPDDAALLFETALWHERAGVVDVAQVYARRAQRAGHEGAQALLDRLGGGGSGGSGG